MKKSKEKLTYLAGYIDGDGCISVSRTRQNHKNILVYEYQLNITSTDPSPLQYFKEEFGGFINIYPKRERKKVEHRWVIKGKASAELLQEVEPFLIDKRYQAQYFIKLSHTISSNNFKSIENSVLETRNELVSEIRANKHTQNLIDKQVISNIKPLSCTIQPTDYDYIYLAGLIDSEGCLRIRKWKPRNRPNNIYSAMCEIGNTKSTIIKWLIERFGGSISFVPSRANRKASATWGITGAVLQECLHRIKPFLINKRLLCDKIIEFQDTVIKNGGDRHSKQFKSAYKQIIALRDRLVSEVHIINRKGSH